MNFKEYIEYIKTKPCSICFKFPVDAHHLEAIGMGNNRQNDTPKDLTCVPLCREHHSEYHNIGFKCLFSKYNINLWEEAFNLLRSQILHSDKVFEIIQDTEPRTSAQNDYYHGTVCKILSEFFGYERIEMHQALKEHFKVKSTSKLSKGDFTYYLDRIIRWAATEHSVIIPDAIKK